MHKNCCNQSCSFWLRYAPNRLSAGASPQTPLGSLQCSHRPPSQFRGWAPREREGGREGERREGKVGEGVPECPNPELASLCQFHILFSTLVFYDLHGHIIVHIISKFLGFQMRLHSGALNPNRHSSMRNALLCLQWWCMWPLQIFRNCQSCVHKFSYLYSLQNIHFRFFIFKNGTTL